MRFSDGAGVKIIVSDENDSVLIAKFFRHTADFFIGAFGYP